MSTVLDKEVLKKSLVELAEKEPDYVQKLISEIDENLKTARRKRFEAIVKEDFEKYDDVFRALA